MRVTHRHHLLDEQHFWRDETGLQRKLRLWNALALLEEDH